MEYASTEEVTYFWLGINEKTKEIIKILSNENITRVNLIMEKVNKEIKDKFSVITLFPMVSHCSDSEHPK
jgi:hypothetical protein